MLYVTTLLAWAALAEAYADLFVWGYCCDQSLLDKSKQHSNKAITIDPACQHAHWSRALAYHLSFKPQDLAISQSAIDTLFAINTNAAGFVSGGGLLLSLQGQWQAGLGLIQQFYNRSFKAPRWINLARYLFSYMDGNLQQLLIESETRKTEMYPWDTIITALCHWNLEQHEESCATFRALVTQDSRFGDMPEFSRNYVSAFVKDSEVCQLITDDIATIVAHCGSELQTR